MKKYAALSLALAFCAVLFSFSDKKGGDVFEIYLNGKQVHQQFVHIDKSVKTIYLSSLSDNDKIDVYYSHCGYAGKARVITIRNEKNELLKRLEFGDGNGARSPMSFYRKDIAKTKTGKVSITYSSKELPEGKLLATIVWGENKAMAKL